MSVSGKASLQHTFISYNQLLASKSTAQQSRGGAFFREAGCRPVRIPNITSEPAGMRGSMCSPLSLSLSLLALTHTLTLSLFSLSLSLSHTHTHSLSFSHTHTHKHTHTGRRRARTTTPTASSSTAGPLEVIHPPLSRQIRGTAPCGSRISPASLLRCNPLD